MEEEEGPAKRPKKSHNFDTNEQAKEYVATLPPELWYRIIMDNRQLSVRDIERMCNVSTAFQEFCRDTGIWRSLLNREVSYERQADLREAVTRFLPYKAASLNEKMMLILSRIVDNPGRREGGRFSLWKFKTTEKNGTKWEVDIELEDTNQFGRDLGLFFNVLLPGETRVRIGTRRPPTFQSVILLLKDLGALNLGLIFQNQYYWKNYGFVLQSSDNLGKFPLAEYERRLDMFVIGLIYYFLTKPEFIVVETTPQMKLLNRKICGNLTCSRMASSMCGMCREAFYCSQECADLDWARHESMSHK